MVQTDAAIVENDNGRLEQRRHTVCHDIDWLWSGRRYKDEPRFPHLAMIAMVESRTELSGKIQTERRYYLSSAKLSPETFAAAMRAHWGVGNRLYWVLDVVFHNDPVRLRTGLGPQNMAMVKYMPINLVRNPKDKHSLKVRRKKANLNDEYLESLITQAENQSEVIPLGFARNCAFR